ncbi:MarR family winged helix-turn-helix transcriptional regulator [Spirilliplanes yamanashiensis]|uniref:MarR family transcriptional regulator n=1 Tax=Spirilliplanes yamanashiensis TaxID=42233 RepID=A0A8J3YC72_9ACTN|nr:MarR family winged helix-turn-helix transcriptional regulator [Spirilliplanes yamanashiensis]MDP9818624.1 DNA-binding MarR family transcriptional regulator [Spirilliplanes yamanashiensis]GIJ05080.1 MarR family transcriptional regulator [Spirilliplanes yamanashiensis]
MGDHAGDLGEAVATLHHALRRATVRATGRPELPAAQNELLKLVERRPGIGVTAAAEQLGIAPNTASTLVGEAVAAGLVTRERDTGDRRTVRLLLTDEARRRLERYRDLRRTLVAVGLGELPPEARRELAAAVPHLRRLAELLGGQG